MAWRIEKAKTDRSTCRHCGLAIAKGEQRFGNDDLNAFWYHLACAPLGKPRAWKPFAKQAAKLGASKPAKQPSPPAAKAKRNAALEAQLLADPDDTELRTVFADWLQSQGDPWGELIAYAEAGKKKDIKRVLAEHADSLTGGFGARTFDWKGGFIDVISLQAKASHQLAKILELRTTLLTRALYIPMSADDAAIAAVSTRAPRALRKLFTWLDNPVGKLAIPSLRRLSLFSRPSAKLDPKAFAPLFAAKGVPALRQLEFFSGQLPVAFVSALLDSKLIKQLDGLEIRQGALGPDAATLLAERKADLAHLTYVDFDMETTPKLKAAFAKQIAAYYTFDIEDD